MDAGRRNCFMWRYVCEKQEVHNGINIRAAENLLRWFPG